MDSGLSQPKHYENKRFTAPHEVKSPVHAELGGLDREALVSALGGWFGVVLVSLFRHAQPETRAVTRHHTRLTKTTHTLRYVTSISL